MSFLNNHRGPFQLVVSRPAKKAGFHLTEWLPGEVEKDDVWEEARALLADPRDTIEHVAVWSVVESSFCGVIK